MRSGQQGALARDLLDLMDALSIPSATLMGYDWGGRAACIVAALWPERVRALVTGAGYNIQDIAASVTPAAPETEHRNWYQYYFHGARGRDGLAANRFELCKLLWRLWSPTWRFDAATYARSAAAFDNPDFVDIVVHSYRHRFGYAPGDRAYDEIEQALARQPTIAAPTIALWGADDGVDPPPQAIRTPPVSLVATSGASCPWNRSQYPAGSARCDDRGAARPSIRRRRTGLRRARSILSSQRPSGRSTRARFALNPHQTAQRSSVAQLGRAGDDLVALAQPVIGEEVVGPAAGLAHQQDAGEDVPGINVELEIAVGPAARHRCHAERAGAEAAELAAGGEGAADEIEIVRDRAAVRRADLDERCGMAAPLTRIVSPLQRAPRPRRAVNISRVSGL